MNNMWTNYKRLLNGFNVNTIIHVVYKSHYEVLNIQNNATHKEIKDAYYRLSMIYHPDKNKGSEVAAKNFRDITIAYEILGNVRQRKLYDSGTTPTIKTAQYTTKQPFEAMNTNNEGYKKIVRSRDYYFDNQSKAHYSKAFQTHHIAKEKLSRININQYYVKRQNTYSVLTIVVSISIFILIYMHDSLVIEFKQDNIKLLFKNSDPATKKD